jgi:ABC-2 type transport system permease protein
MCSRIGPGSGISRTHLSMRSYFQLELKSLLASRGLWVLLLFTAPLIGYSYIQAVNLYSEASRPALVTAQMASGLNPFDGVIVPTFGSIYLALTLLFPFVAIRTIAGDRDNGALLLLLQIPSHSSVLLSSKVATLLLALFFVELPGLFTLILWRLVGQGHIYAPEMLCLLLGHLLYVLSIIAISLFCASITETASTAALLALACTLGSWVLDFAAAGGGFWATQISVLSLTSSLKPFEQGLIVWRVVAGVLLAAVVLFALTLLWWHPGRPMSVKLARSVGLLVVGVALSLPLHYVVGSVDLTEDQRHSFSSGVRVALEQIHEPVRVEVYLAPEDPRFMDFDRSILAKLKRVLPQAQIVNREANQAALFRTGEDPNYGLIVYQVGTRRGESRSTSPEEVLPLLWSLGSVTPPGADDQTTYPGYPVVVRSSRSAELIFYVLCPAICFAGWFLFSRR